jgi:HipA-like C-terminal domain
MDIVTPKALAVLSLGPTSNPEMARVLGASQSTISRTMRALERDQQVLRIGKTRGARYALRRNITTIGSHWPVYRIDETGAVQELGNLESLERNSYYVTGGPPRIQQLFEGIPYFIQDARPGGFLGRTVPAAYPELELPARVIDWTDEHFLVYLTQRGADTTGALVVGTEAMDRHLSGAQSRPAVPADARASEFPRYATAAMAGAPPGSSANGEHPKFTTCVAEHDRRVAVIVKFSPPRSTLTGQRWADLLIAEHLAHRVLNEHGIDACRSEILQHEDRVFLQCERFDRVNTDGRRSVVSLFALDTWRYGKLDSWTASAGRLALDGLLSAEDADRIRLLDAFGALTANTDRHFGNITLFDDYAGAFRLAPVYDMLPMLFAPQNDQIVPRQFEPTAPTSAWLSVWSRARLLADSYWERLIAEASISTEFRHLCAQSLAALRALPSRGTTTAADRSKVG